MSLFIAHRLMDLPMPVWRRLPRPVTAWAVHTHLMQFVSYRRFVDPLGGHSW